MSKFNTTLTPHQALILRLVVGLVFGLALGWLSKATDHTGPQIAINVATSTLALGAFVIWAGAGAMRRVSLAVWTLIALGLIAFLAWTAVAHTIQADYNPLFFNESFLIYPFLFIAHELVSSGDQAGKPVAPYALYFDEAWKRGVQLALAVIFTALFWGILWLGATLLGLIGFTWFKDLLTNQYFAFPASGVALASAVQLGDIQLKLMQNFRALVLGVLSWLLPVITVIGLLFAASLCVSGLAPLWATKAATASLLAACISLVLLINAAYQQGDAERPVHMVIRWSARLACGLLLVFAGLAAVSLWLRIAQYGLSPERILAAVGVIIAALFGLGYAFAAVLPKGRWLHPVEKVNIFMAFIMAALILCVLAADPRRLTVQSQVARLQSGAVTAAAFDWRVLRFETGTYGAEALTALSKDGKTPAIKTAAFKAKALKEEDRYTPEPEPVAVIYKPDAKALHVVMPAGAVLPESFMQQGFSANDGSPACLTKAGYHCNVAVLDLNDDGKLEVILSDGNALSVYAQGPDGWVRQGDILFIAPATAADFAAGKVKAVKPLWNDLMVGDVRKRVTN